jgi:glycosyltransferase involved in cell wall biosynthesis
MRLLHVLPSLQQSYGGPLRAVLDLSARANDLGLQSEILGFGRLDIPDNPFPTECIHMLPVSAPRRYCYAPQLRGWLAANLERFNGVVLHGMWLYPNWSTASACVQAGILYACFPHGMLEPWAVYQQGPWKTSKKILYWQLCERKIFRNARCVYFTTNRERELARSTFHLGGTHLLLAPYGVDVSAEPVLNPASPHFVQPPDRKISLFLGRLHPKKNIELLLEAWRLARPPGVWHLVIAGSGDDAYTRKLENLIVGLGLSGNVHLVGFVAGRDKSYLLQRASWFLLPSRQENFGIAVLEAINHGCPVAISDQVFLTESLHDRSEVLPLSLDRWVAFIRERMVDDGWRSTLVSLDRIHLLEKMNIQKVARDWATTLSATFSEGSSACASLV